MQPSLSQQVCLVLDPIHALPACRWAASEPTPGRPQLPWVFANAFTAEPKLAADLPPGYRHHAACAAALAAAGSGKDASKLDHQERLCLRAQAYDWLRADLAVWAHLVKDDAKARPQAQRTLAEWQKDPNLASVRDQDALAKLP